ncbi:HNH endonuclease signature motif containing protein [Corynebacterium aquatimens]|uniref:HNH nuclease domain-containing protein n=1 Tax=Corynebacterium aquatimens TaxID=1190508 RepID=A0A931DYL0_9CORY|nr:HNH endonuclease signature motif containing protein [Corynebacterium aquatimens]MBG6122495.1 hypothetical protein [Corynebacterium aquatimens]WJY64965.1 HNH endonuclease [Corynebacterium aquatimens]
MRTQTDSAKAGGALTGAVDKLCDAIAEISRVFADPSPLRFTDVRNDMERLEAAVSGQKAYVDAAFAYLCERDGAGKVVGANHAVAYLRDVLGLSHAEAMGRLRRGADLFEEVPEFDVEEDSLFDDVDPDTPNAAEEAAAAAAAAEEARRRAEEERAAKKKAKERAKKVAEEKQKIINLELMKLRDGADPGRATILAEALAEAEKRSPEDLRKFVRRLVRDANKRGRRKAANKPQSDFHARNLHFGQQDADGMCSITIKAPAGEAAMLKAALDYGRGGGQKPGDPHAKDTRTMGQRHFDQLMGIVRTWSNSKSTSQNGVGTVVLGITLDDLAGADHTSRFATNTGIEVSVYDLLRLGFVGNDFVAQLDTVTGVPLSLGRTRLASVYQRIALLAMQGVCAWHGCDKPFSELDIHHILPYLDGGPTDIDNLVGLCRAHHRCNNDRRDGTGNKGYVDRDPETGRVGVVPADGGPMRFNDTVGYHDSCGHKLRKRRDQSGGNSNPPPDTESPPDSEHRDVPRQEPSTSTPSCPDPVLFPVPDTQARTA